MRARLVRRAALALLLAAMTAAPAAAALFSPNRPLRTIRTEWFDISFPEDARFQAERLASFADDAYRQIAGFLGTKPRLRFPVILCPDADGPNGYFSVWPRRRIVLNLAPTDPNDGFGYQSDDLRALFRHELAHAVSLTIRPVFWDAAVVLFGDPAGISYFTTPANLAEGVSIAAEGMDGRGRAADPLTADELRQDAREGRFKSFWESAGAWDRYPYGRVPYSYGALFTRYLLEEYGEESYRELWRRMGEGLILPGLGDFLFIRGVFRQVYGLSLSEAWGNFERRMTPSSPATEPERHTPPGLLGALAAAGDTVWRADGAARRILALDARTGRPAGSLPGDASITRLSASSDGLRLLVSHSTGEGGEARLVLRIVDLETGKSRVLPHRGLRDGAWAGMDILAVRAEFGAASLVLLRDGREEILFPGGPSVSWASPCASPDGRWVYALRREDGETTVARFPAPSPGRTEPARVGTGGSASPDSGGSADRAVRPWLERLALPEGFETVRDLSVDTGGTLRFSVHDGEAYRTAELRGDVLRYPADSYAGGARRAAAAGGRVFFLGEYSEGVVLCTVPEGAAWEEIPADWLPDPGGTKIVKNPDLPAPVETRPYSALSGLVPTVRYPAFRFSSEGYGAVGAGAAGGDPAETFVWEARALWVPGLGAADLDLELEITAFAPILAITASDGFAPDGAGTVRTTRAGLSLDRRLSRYGGFELSARAGVEALWFTSLAPGEDPYGPRDASVATATAAASFGRWAYDIRKPGALKGAGFGLTLFGAGVLPPGVPESLAGIEGSLRLRALPLALALDLHGAAALSPGLSYGPGGRVFAGFAGGASFPGYQAWAGAGSGPWYAYAESSVSPLALEIQGRLGPVHLQRLIFSAGGRAALADGEPRWSAYSRATLDFAPLLGLYARLRPRAWAEAEYAPDPDRVLIRWAVEVPL